MASDLSSIDLEADLPQPARPPRSMAKVGTTKLPQGYRFWYDTVIDVMLERPELPLYKIGELIGREPSWIYLLAKSDSFRLHYEERRREHNDRLTAGIVERAGKVAKEALDILLHQLETNPEKTTPKMALEISNTLMGRMGMGNDAGRSPVVVNQTTVVASASPEELTRARDLIKAAEAARLAKAPKTIEHEKDRP